MLHLVYSFQVEDQQESILELKRISIPATASKLDNEVAVKIQVCDLYNHKRFLTWLETNGYDPDAELANETEEDTDLHIGVLC